MTISGFDYQRIAEWAHKPCLEQIEAAGPFIKEVQTVFIGGMWSYQTPNPDFNLAVEGFVESNSAKEIVILSQVPRFTRDVMRLHRFASFGLKRTLSGTQVTERSTVFKLNWPCAIRT